MTNPEMQISVWSTSAAGPMLAPWTALPATIAGLLAGIGTSAALFSPPEAVRRSHDTVEQTTAGASVAAAQPAGAAIGEVRRLSGLTWDQLARMFGVSRRSLHCWASGKPMASGNEEHLQRVRAVLRMSDRGTASANRSALLAIREDATMAFDLLANGDDQRALSMLGCGDGRRAAPPALSEDARAARTPRPPAELVGALQDRIHPTSGRLLAAKPIADSRRK